MSISENSFENLLFYYSLKYFISFIEIISSTTKHILIIYVKTCDLHDKCLKKTGAV